MALLTLKDIGKIYVSEGNVAVGIRGVNLSFDRGEFVAITGKSGSGKSTLLNVISGMDSYEEGELYIEGQTTSHYLQPEWEEYREKYISFIFQDYNIIESFTVLQNVELALMHIEDKKARRERAMELIKRVGLASYVKQKGSKLSGGQKQRTVIARALAKDSPIILADEPTGNLDSATSKEIIELLREVSKDTMAVLLVLMSVCMYFIMRSSLMGRIKEVGIYRAIGVSKKNLVFKFFIEAIVLTTLTVFIGYLLTSAFLFACLEMSSLIAEIFYYPLWLAGAVLAILYVISLFFGTLPITSLLRKTPSEILAKYDI